MASGIDITLEGGGGERRIRLGGIPFETLRDLVETRFGSAPVLVSPRDDAVRRKVPLGEGEWSRIPAGEGLELSVRWSCLDVHLLESDPPESGWDVAPEGGGRPETPPGSFLVLRSDDGGASVALQAEDGLLRDLLLLALRAALEEGGEAGPGVEIPEEVADRCWAEAPSPPSGRGE